MRLIGQEVDALAEHQLNEFAGERLLAGLSLKCRSRPGVAFPTGRFVGGISRTGI